MAKLRPGTQVRDRREQLGLTREKLAYKADVSTSTVARLELADKLPGTGGLIRISRILGLSLDELTEPIVVDEVPA